MAASSSPNASPETIDCRTRLRASRPSPAPMRCAVCTQKPTISARHSPPNSHVVDATSPMAAEAFVPSEPTMDVSIYCMMMEETCARMAGTLSCATSPICCRSESLRPARNAPRRSCFMGGLLSN